MKAEELREEVGIEIELIESTLMEPEALRNDVANREPAVREKTAAAAFMAQFYGGIENILKRISIFNSVPLPSGDAWHIELFERFRTPPYQGLPELFSEALAAGMAPFRKFRHVVYHGYGFQLDWQRMKEGLDRIDDVFSQFKAQLSAYLKTIPE